MQKPYFSNNEIASMVVAAIIAALLNLLFNGLIAAVFHALLAAVCALSVLRTGLAQKPPLVSGGCFFFVLLLSPTVALATMGGYLAMEKVYEYLPFLKDGDSQPK